MGDKVNAGKICSGMTYDNWALGQCKVQAEQALQNTSRDFCSSGDVVSCFQKNPGKWSGTIKMGSKEVPSHIFWRYLRFVEPGVPQKPQVDLAIADKLAEAVDTKLIAKFTEMFDIPGLANINFKVGEGKVLTSASDKAEHLIKMLNEAVAGGKATVKVGDKDVPLIKITAATKMADIKNAYSNYILYVANTLNGLLDKAKSGATGDAEENINIAQAALKKMIDGAAGYKSEINESKIVADVHNIVSPLLQDYYNRMGIAVGKKGEDKKLDGSKILAKKYKVGGSEVSVADHYPIKAPTSLEELRNGSEAFIGEIASQASSFGVESPGGSPASGGDKSWITASGSIGASFTNRQGPAADAMKFGGGIKIALTEESKETGKGHFLSLGLAGKYKWGSGALWYSGEPTLTSDSTSDSKVFILIGPSLGGSHNLGDKFTLKWNAGIIGLGIGALGLAVGGVQGPNAEMYNFTGMGLGFDLSAAIAINDLWSIDAKLFTGHPVNVAVTAGDYIEDGDDSWATGFNAGVSYTNKKSIFSKFVLNGGGVFGHNKIDGKYASYILAGVKLSLGKGFGIGTEDFVQFSDIGLKVGINFIIDWVTEDLLFKGDVFNPAIRVGGSWAEKEGEVDDNLWQTSSTNTLIRDMDIAYNPRSWDLHTNFAYTIKLSDAIKWKINPWFNVGSATIDEFEEMYYAIGGDTALIFGK